MPLSFDQFKQLRDKGLTTEQIAKFEGGEKPTGEIMSPQTGRQEMVDRLAQQRPDVSQQAGEQILNLGQTMGQSPLTAPLQPASALLQSAGGAFQRAESAVANPLIEMGRGNFGAIPQAAWQGITGQRRGEMGDVARQAGLPEPAAAAFGLLSTGMIGGGLSKLAQGTQQAKNLVKLETTYGRDISKGIIRHSTALNDTAIDWGQKTAWKGIKDKKYLDPELPGRLVGKVVNSMDDIASGEYKAYGSVMDKVKEGVASAPEVYNSVKGVLFENGYLDPNRQKIQGPILKDITNVMDKAQINWRNRPDISLDAVNSVKAYIKKKVPSTYWEGKTKNLNEEQKVARDVVRKLDEIIANNAKDVSLTEAKTRYREFKNAEALARQLFEKKEGQSFVPTVDRAIKVFGVEPAAAVEDLNTLKFLNDFMKSKEYGGFYDDLLNWNLANVFRVKPNVGGVYQKLSEASKGLSRSYLKYMPTGPTGRVMETAIDRGMVPASRFAYENVKIPAYLRYATGRNEEK